MMLNNEQLREYDNKEHRNRAIKQFMTKIQGMIEVKNTELVDLQNNFHIQRILNKVSNRSISNETLKEIGFDGAEKVNDAIKNNTYLNAINDKKNEITELEDIVHILEKEYPSDNN